MNNIENLDLKSMDIVEVKKEQLKQIFPEVFTEDKIDFEKLKIVLGLDIETSKERYGMTWPSKSDCFKLIQSPSIATLKPARDESIDFDTTENIFIEGENLEVLKLLQKSYYGKIKMIYIDPPYNTGNDFIYKDDYKDNLRNYLEYTGQIDSEGKKFFTNTDTEGRFHTNWLNMMYPRLYLAKNLLAGEGIIFISIDDNELGNLKKIVDEIFGEENFIGIITWIKKTKPINSGSARFQLQKKVEYILCYSKLKKNNETFCFLLKDQGKREYSFDGKLGKCRLKDIEDSDYGRKKRDTMKFPILGVLPPKGKRWKIGEIEVKKLIERNRIEIVDNKIKVAIYREDEVDIIFKPFWSHFELDQVGTAETGKKELNALINKPVGFDTVKPKALLSELISHISSGGIFLDFFSGTSSFAHAILDLNYIDKGNRNFICVQIPEYVEENSDIFKAGFKTIADIGKERIRRVIKKIKEEKQNKLDFENNLDLGFKVFKLDKSNFNVWDGENVPKDKESIQKQLEMHIDHISPLATEDDILYEIIIKAGFELTTKVELLNINNKTVYSIGDGSMLICLDKNLNKELIKEIADKVPGRVVFLDEGFKGNDELKTNAIQIIKSKGIEDFKTI